jgi:hypothetical protein
VLFAGLAASGSAAVGAPRNDDCVNCGTEKPYNSENPARIRQEMDRRRAPDADVPAQGETPAPPVRDTYTPPRETYAPKECADCPPPKHYDKIEVVKTSRDVDQSRVLNTESVVQVPPRVKEVNKLVIHENETRNVGVIQHNHRIIEKEIRYVKRAPVYRHHQAPAYRVQTVLVPVVVQQPPCGCPCTCSGHGYAQQYVYGDGYSYSSGRGGLLQHLQQSQQVQVQQVQVQQVLVPYGYGYR